jgi:DNA-binding response OmpR family regulator
LRVLVIDDEQPIGELIALALTLEGVAVYMAANGQEGLDEINTNAWSFDVIILDLLMPVMDGRTFYRRLHELPAPPPVLLLSAQGATEAQRELGAAASMAKPFDPQELVSRVLALGRR